MSFKRQRYIAYSATINQGGAADPTAIVFRSDIGTISYSRVGVGSYLITTTGVFTSDKFQIFIGPVQVSAAQAGVIAGTIWYTHNRISDTQIELLSFLTNPTGGQPVLSDSLILANSLEIRVYP